MWTSNRGHIFRVDGIQCHNIGLFSNGFDVYWERLHLSTRFEPDSVRKTEVTADSTMRQVDRW